MNFIDDFLKIDSTNDKVEKEDKTNNKTTMTNIDGTVIIYNLSTGLNLTYKPQFIDKKLSYIYFKVFESNIIYNSAEESKVKIYGKLIEIPRSQIAYGEKGTFYKFAGTTIKAKDWNLDGPVEKILLKIRHDVEVFTGYKFNFVLINKYENGDKYIGYHSDDEKDLGPNPNIVGVSFGAKRPIYFKHKNAKDAEIKLDLNVGSLVMMTHPTNMYWKHSIPKKKDIGCRISLTFRLITNIFEN